MATVHYSKTYFNPPSQITEEAYNVFRRKLGQNPDYKIDPNPQTFSEKFSGRILTVGITGGLFLLGLLFTADDSGSDSSIWNPIMGISIFVCIVSIAMLFLEGPSYATFIKEKEEYFKRMKYAIQNTSSYWEFVNAFYK